jgi:alpha-tubulin suppressor-like RCC1 family protein
VAVAAGRTHSVAVKNDGTVWAWGQNELGQLGDGTTISRALPVQVQDIDGVTAIAAHDKHTLALCEDGTVWAWGDNGRGQLGNGTWVSHSAVPVQAQGLANITAIAAGWGHSLALRNDGLVFAWGCLRHGSSPTAQHTQSCAVPQKVDISNVTAIAAGGTTGAALCADGTVWTWQAADPAPVQVPELSGVKAIAVGVNHVLALKNDGTLWAWGDNKFGQLGDGTTEDSDVPVQLPEFNGITAIAAQDHSLALKSDGVVWAWGSNIQGQLGNGNGGTAQYAATPVPVQSPFQRGLLKDNVLNLFDTAPWWRGLPDFFQFVLRWLLFGWLWM